METDARVSAVTEVVDEILNHGAYKCTRYLGDKLTVKGTRKRYSRKYEPVNVEIMLTIGEPNYEERKNIERAKKDGNGPIEKTAKYSKK